MPIFLSFFHGYAAMRGFELLDPFFSTPVIFFKPFFHAGGATNFLHRGVAVIRAGFFLVGSLCFYDWMICKLSAMTSFLSLAVLAANTVF